MAKRKSKTKTRIKLTKFDPVDYLKTEKDMALRWRRLRGTEPPLGGLEAMARLNAAEIAELLREMGRRMAFRGGNPYRAKAYLRAADNLALAMLPVERLIAEDRLKEIPGVGDALAGVIKELHQTGRTAK